jgi:hypothetical protein
MPPVPPLGHFLCYAQRRKCGQPELAGRRVPILVFAFTTVERWGMGGGYAVSWGILFGFPDTSSVTLNGGSVVSHNVPDDAFQF